MAPTSPASSRAPRCPKCGAAIVWAGNSQRPFCSLACRLIDLGGWLDERYRIEAEPLADSSEAESVARPTE